MTGKLLIQFLSDPEWDQPFFKRLALNDTGSGNGHQSGPYIPKSIQDFFPVLDTASTSAARPTVDTALVAELYFDGHHIGIDVVRYQVQTWKGTRRPEPRLTGNLGPLYSKAEAGDMMVMQRSRDRLDYYRLFVFKKLSPAFQTLDEVAGSRGWGALFMESPPVSQQDIVAARTEMLADAVQPFVPVRESVSRVTMSRKAIARDTAFRETLLTQYHRRCSVSGIALATHSLAETEAAHVIPIGRGGADEPRNGITLTGTLHWAFDRGLFGISENRRVFVPAPVLAMPENEWLVQFHEKQISEADKPSLRTAAEAFAWHRTNILAQWS